MAFGVTMADILSNEFDSRPSHLDCQHVHTVTGVLRLQVASLELPPGFLPKGVSKKKVSISAQVCFGEQTLCPGVSTGVQALTRTPEVLCV